MIKSRENAEIPVYLTCEDWKSCWSDDIWKQLAAGMDDASFHEQRNEAAIRAVLTAIAGVIPKDLQSAIVSVADQHPLLFLLDELGSYPSLMRALCAVHLQLEHRIHQEFPYQNRCLFLVGGTGADAVPLSVGSCPEQFNVITMPTNKSVWEHLVKTTAYSPVAAAFVQVLEKNPTAQSLATNPRIAAIMNSILAMTMQKF